MKKLVTLMLCCALIFSCFAAGESSRTAMHTLYSAEVTTLNYLCTTTLNEYTIAANVIDTLIEHDCYGRIVPCLAESWETSDDGLPWTFHLRRNATWVRANGEYYADVTAYDFVTSAGYILNARNASPTAWILYEYLLGAREYFDSTSAPAEGEAANEPFDFENVGVKALDAYTIAYTTTHPCPYFLSMLDYVCYMPLNEQFLNEAGENFGLAVSAENLLYCGAYVLSEFMPQEKHVYTVNESYWDAEHVYITEIQETYNKEATTLAPRMYLRGEIDTADISSTIADQWLADEKTADLIHPVRQIGQFSFFWCFNFDPRFDEAYEPDNWTLAVNNESFRQSIMFALDRIKAKSVVEPEYPEDLLWDTITPRNIAMYEGVDYTDTGALNGIEIICDAETALEYKRLAMEELTAQGVTFPIKILTVYNPSSTFWAEECQVVEQQLESVLGTDYIDVVIEAGPTSGFLQEIRRSGRYAFMKCNWGLDFDDPVNLTEPFKENNTFNFMIKATDPALMGEDGTLEYYTLLARAKAMDGKDVKARYEAFAEAEAYIISHAIAIPYGSNTGGYTASRLNTFEGQFSASGLATCRYKGMHLLEKPMNTEEYYDAYDAWLDARDALNE